MLAIALIEATVRVEAMLLCSWWVLLLGPSGGPQHAASRQRLVRWMLTDVHMVLILSNHLVQ